MTDLEKTTYADGFLLVQLNCIIDSRRDVFAASVEVFDGGRSVSRHVVEQPYFADRGSAVSQLQTVLAGALAAGAVPVASGSGWRELFEPVVGELEHSARVLELMPTVKALTGLHGNVTVTTLAEALGVERLEEATEGLPSFPEAFLWAVVAVAGKRGLDWDGLLSLCDESRPTVELDAYAFGEIALSLLPEVPAVYIMKDENGAPLYVGKAANLKRRFNDYFRATHDISLKLRAIRDQIRSFEYQRVGSELEALLLEHRLICELAPPVNTQRAIRAVGQRYGRQPFPVMIILPSAKSRRVEVLLLGVKVNCVQLRVLPNRPPVQRLQALAALIAQVGNRAIHRKEIVQWGEDGCEIAWRYWGRYKHTLQWTEISSQIIKHADSERLRTMLKISSETVFPGEFRT